METVGLLSQTMQVRILSRVPNKRNIMSDKNTEHMHRAMQLREELFNLANSFAGDEYGHIAGVLHQACNEILYAERDLVVLDDSYKIYYSKETV